MVPPLRAATADARMMTGDTQDRDKKKLSKPRTAPNAAMPEPSWAFPPLNEGAGKSAAKRQATLTKPAKSLGTLEEIPVQLARLQGTDLPRARPAATILFAADHSVCQHGVSAYPSTVTAAMVRNFAVGGAAASVAASHLDIPLQVVDVGVAHPYGDTEGSGAVVVRHPVADATEGDVRTEDAMSWETLADAIDAGRTAVDRLSADTRVLVLGEMGIGNTTLASAMACALLDAAPELVVGRGTGVDDAQLAVKCAVVHDAVERVHDRSPLGVLRCLGGRELAAIYGAAARACERRMAVLVDGFIVSTALLALVREHPEAGPHLVFGHRSREPGHAAVLEALGARPLVDLSMALGEGSGALAAFPLLDLACRLHRDMATFEEAGVPERDS